MIMPGVWLQSSLPLTSRPLLSLFLEEHTILFFAYSTVFTEILKPAEPMSQALSSSLRTDIFTTS